MADSKHEKAESPAYEALEESVAKKMMKKKVKPRGRPAMVKGR